MILIIKRNSRNTGFEDCVVAKCAESCNADYIITRNVKDFAGSSVRAITPEEFLELGKEKTE